MQTATQTTTIAATLQKYFDCRRVPAAQQRLANLIAIDAPAIIIEQEKKLATLAHWAGEGEKIVKKATKRDGINYAALNVLSVTPKTGRGGKPYYLLTIEGGQPVLFFPAGRYGAFISTAD